MRKNIFTTVGATIFMAVIFMAMGVSLFRESYDVLFFQVIILILLLLIISREKEMNEMKTESMLSHVITDVMAHKMGLKKSDPLFKIVHDRYKVVVDEEKPILTDVIIKNKLVKSGVKGTPNGILIVEIPKKDQKKEGHFRVILFAEADMIPVLLMAGARHFFKKFDEIKGQKTKKVKT